MRPASGTCCWCGQPAVKRNGDSIAAEWAGEFGGCCTCHRNSKGSWQWDSAPSLGAQIVSGAARTIAEVATQSAMSGENFGRNLVRALPSIIGSIGGQALGDRFGFSAGIFGGEDRDGIIGVLQDALEAPTRVGATVGRTVADVVADVGDAVSGVFKGNGEQGASANHLLGPGWVENDGVLINASDAAYRTIDGVPVDQYGNPTGDQFLLADGNFSERFEGVRKARARPILTGACAPTELLCVDAGWSADNHAASATDLDSFNEHFRNGNGLNYYIDPTESDGLEQAIDIASQIQRSIKFGGVMKGVVDDAKLARGPHVFSLLKKYWAFDPDATTTAGKTVGRFSGQITNGTMQISKDGSYIVRGELKLNMGLYNFDLDGRNIIHNAIIFGAGIYAGKGQSFLPVANRACVFIAKGRYIP